MDETITTILACTTILRVVLVILRQHAVGTPGVADDDGLNKLAGAVDWLERLLDWVSVGPTHRKR